MRVRRRYGGEEDFTEEEEEVRRAVMQLKDKRGGGVDGVGSEMVMNTKLQFSVF